MLNLENKKIGLVLSGGGAKGAYQIGMLRALEEAGMQKQQLVMAGTSIGAVNALLYAIGGVNAIGKFMNGMSDLMEEFNEGSEDLTENYIGLFEESYPDDLLQKNRIPIMVCAYSVEDEKPEYFKLNEMSAKDQKLIVRASSSLPAVAPAVEYRGKSYVDGGIIPENCKNPAPADKIPLSALRGIKGIDAYIVSFLKPEDQVDHSWIGKEKDYLESRPSVPLEDRINTGTLDFSKERLRKSEERGYRETLQLIYEKYLQKKQERG